MLIPLGTKTAVPETLTKHKPLFQLTIPKRITGTNSHCVALAAAAPLICLSMFSNFLNTFSSCLSRCHISSL